MSGVTEPQGDKGRGLNSSHGQPGKGAVGSQGARRGQGRPGPPARVRTSRSGPRRAPGPGDGGRGRLVLTLVGQRAGHSRGLAAASGARAGGSSARSCPGARPSPTPSPALHFLLMKYAWGTDVPAPPGPAPAPSSQEGSQVPLPMAAWPACLILMRGGALASQWGAGGVCVYLHIYTQGWAGSGV